MVLNSYTVRFHGSPALFDVQKFASQLEGPEFDEWLCGDYNIDPSAFV